jgi:hypothetical protein
VADTKLRNVIGQLRRLAGAPEAAGLTDGHLLGRFLSGRDEAAFELLVWRHGTMVRNVCRRLLRREADAGTAPPRPV